MGYEVDFIDVGEGEKSGDAICLRFGNLYGARDEQFVMVIDGGTRDSGERMVEHIREHYGTDNVDLVVSTHPHNDHVSGLRTVIEELTVERLWMHRPWEHTNDSKELRESLESAVELEQLAIDRGIPIDEPFSDAQLPFGDLGITVLGPSSTYYDDLLPDFQSTPDTASATAQPGLGQRAGTALMEVVAKVAEGWGVETLTDPAEDATSAENNSSVVLSLVTDERRLLLTGDAGVPALERAADTAELLGIDLPSCTFVQVPHHGSRRNVGPTVLDRILGPKGQDANKSAFISAAKESDKHPAKKVCNAFQRRGARDRVHATKGLVKRHHHDAPARDGWSSAEPLPFYDEVED